MKVSASVFMTLQVEVYVGDWEAAQPFEQLHKQAAREAEEAMSKLLTGQNKVSLSRKPAVMHVVTKEKAS